MPAKKRPVSKARKPAKKPTDKLSLAGEKPSKKKVKKKPAKGRKVVIGGEAPPSKKKSRIS